jgi:hypothetical protein
MYALGFTTRQIQDRLKDIYAVRNRMFSRPYFRLFPPAVFAFPPVAKRRRLVRGGFKSRING